MTDKVYVSLKGVHLGVNDSGERQDDSIEVINVGKYSQINGKEYIKYDEIIHDDKLSKAMIKIDGDSVELTRKGELSSHLVFEQGKKHVSYYDTPFGNMLMGINTSRLSVVRAENQIDIEINYTIEINYQKVNDSCMKIRIQSEAYDIF